jgi:hypothetical protein
LNAEKAALEVLFSRPFLQDQSLVGHAESFVISVLIQSFCQDIHWIEEGETSHLTVGLKRISIRAAREGLGTFRQLVGKILDGIGRRQRN